MKPEEETKLDPKKIWNKKEIITEAYETHCPVTKNFPKIKIIKLGIL